MSAFLIEHILRRDPDAMAEAVAIVKARPTRYSLLKLFAKSPLQYLIAALTDAAEPTLAARLGAGAGRDSDTALRIGTAVHHMVLGNPHMVAGWQGKRAGAAWERFALERHAMGQVILNSKEAAHARLVASSVLQSQKAQELLLDGTENTRERRIDWTIRGRAIQSTPDAWKPGKYVVDLKTCRDSSPGVFVRQLYGYLYHAQLECYCQALEAAEGIRPASAWVVAVDGKSPARCFEVDPRALEAGARLLGAWSETLSVCEASAHFPYLEVFFAALPDYLDDGPDMLELPPDDEEEEAP